MTQGEYRVKLSSLAHKRDKLLRNKENKGYNLELGRIGKQDGIISLDYRMLKMEDLLLFLLIGDFLSCSLI